MCWAFFLLGVFYIMLWCIFLMFVWCQCKPTRYLVDSECTWMNQPDNSWDLQGGSTLPESRMHWIDVNLLRKVPNRLGYLGLALFPGSIKGHVSRSPRNRDTKEGRGEKHRKTNENLKSEWNGWNEMTWNEMKLIERMIESSPWATCF